MKTKDPYYFQSSWTIHLDKAPHYRTIIRSLLLQFFEEKRRNESFEIYSYTSGEGHHCLRGRAPTEEAFSASLRELNLQLSLWINAKGRFRTPLSSRSHFEFNTIPEHENPPFHTRRSLVGTPYWIRFQRRERYLELVRQKMVLCPTSA